MYFKNLVVLLNSVYEFAYSNIFGCNHKIMIHTQLLTTFLWNNGLANQDVVAKMKYLKNTILESWCMSQPKKNDPKNCCTILLFKGIFRRFPIPKVGGDMH
jgi:hypothetical protein